MQQQHSFEHKHSPCCSMTYGPGVGGRNSTISLPACRNKLLKGGLRAYVVKSIAPSGNALIVPVSSVYDNVSMLKSNVSGGETQIQQLTVNTTQRTYFSCTTPRDRLEFMNNRRRTNITLSSHDISSYIM